MDRGQTLGAVLERVFEQGRRQSPRGQQKGPIFFGALRPSSAWRRRLAPRKPRSQGIDRHRTRDQIRSARAPHEHDLVAVTAADHAVVRCAVPGCRHAERAAIR